jgi:hypothetical protein
MNFNLSIISYRLSLIGFFLLFPLFFIYHFCISQNYFSPFLGGLFGNVALLVAFISFLFLPWFLKTKIKYINIPVFIFYFSIIFYLTWTLGNHFLVQEHPFGYHAFWESYSSFIIWCALFYIGFFLPLETLYFYNLIKYFCFLIFLIFILSIVKQSSFFALFNIFQNSDDSSSMSSYQQAGRSILVSFLFLAIIGRNKLFNLCILLISAIILLSIGSRTDLISIILAILLYCLHLLFKGKGTVLRKTIIFLTLAFTFMLFYFLIQTLFFDSRAAELFDLASSTSWQGRSDLSSNAVLIIIQNPIFGKFDYYDVSGGYAHNILSAWTSFGLFGIILYIFLLIYFLYVSVNNYFFENRLNTLWLLVLSLNLISFSQALIAAPIFYALPALGWGLTLNVYLKSRINKLQIYF